MDDAYPVPQQTWNWGKSMRSQYRMISASFKLACVFNDTITFAWIFMHFLLPFQENWLSFSLSLVLSSISPLGLSGLGAGGSKVGIMKLWGNIWNVSTRKISTISGFDPAFLMSEISFGLNVCIYFSEWIVIWNSHAFEISCFIVREYGAWENRDGIYSSYVLMCTYVAKEINP